MPSTIDNFIDLLERYDMYGFNNQHIELTPGQHKAATEIFELYFGLVHDGLPSTDIHADNIGRTIDGRLVLLELGT